MPEIERSLLYECRDDVLQLSRRGARRERDGVPVSASGILHYIRNKSSNALRFASSFSANVVRTIQRARSWAHPTLLLAAASNSILGARHENRIGSEVVSLASGRRSSFDDGAGCLLAAESEPRQARAAD